jgi:hypothetical protein
MASNKMSVNCFAASHAADRLAVASTAKTRRARSSRSAGGTCGAGDTTLRGLSGSGNARLGGSISGHTACFISRKIPINSVGLFDSAARTPFKKVLSIIFSLQANKLDIIFFLKTANLSH